MRILLLTMGSHGDIHPFIGIGRALRDRGHEATIATNPYYEAQIRAAGTGFAALTEHADLKRIIGDHKVMDPLRGPLVVMRTLTLPLVPHFVQRTRELIRELRPEVVAYHPIVLGAPWACGLEGGVRTVSIAPSPIIWSTPDDRLVMLPFRSAHPTPRAVRFDRFVGRWFMRLALDPGLNRARREIGLPPGRDLFHRDAVGADLNLGIWSPLLRGPLPGDPVNSAITGFTWHDRDHTQETPDAELLAFLDAGPAPVVAALGSTGVHASGRFYQHVVDACRSLGLRALLVVGRDQPPPSNLPTDGRMKAVPYAAFSTIFPRASIVIHHGGAGTTAQGLRSGRPTLITPMARDQFDNAADRVAPGAGEDALAVVTVDRSLTRCGP
ncbi:MAG: glycosyltransferase [Phycisphaerales bacterium]